MKCRECPDYAKCVKESNLKIKRKSCKKAKTEYVMTKADRIRAMSDEELAEMLWKTSRNYRAVCADPVVDYNEHRDHLIAWLHQPAE